MDANDPRAVDFRRAVEHADAEALRALLAEHEALRDAIDSPWFAFGAPAVVYLAKASAKDAFDVLLDAGADLDAKSNWEAGPYSGLDGLVDSPDVDDDFADYLISRGATLDIHAASGLGRLTELARLLDDRPDRVNEPGPDGAAPLHLARNVETAAFLLDRGADIEQRCVDHNSTPLMWSVQRPAEMTRYLVEWGAKPDLFIAAVLNDIGMARSILAKEPDAIHVRVRYGASHDHLGGGDKYVWALDFADTPLEVARRRNHTEVFRFLLSASPPATALLMHARSGDVDAIRALIASHPDLLESLSADQACDVLCGTAEAAGVLLDAGVDPDALDDENGATALHNASWKNDRARVEVLLNHGADPNIRDRTYASTPLGWAHENGHQDLVALYSERFPLDIVDATWMGDEARVLELLAEDPSLAKGADEANASLLRIAAWYGHSGIARALLSHGADPAAKNADTGKTALDLALERDHAEIVEMLTP